MQKDQYPSDIPPVWSTNTPYTAENFEHSKSNQNQVFGNPKSKSVSSKNKLQQHINQGLPVEFWQEFNALSNKCNLEVLTNTELKKLQRLSSDIEAVNNDRLKLLISFSKLVGQSVEDLIADMQVNDRIVVRKGFSDETRKQIKIKSKGLCEYCQSQVAFSFTSYLTNLFIPRKRLGKSDISNLVHSCLGCSNNRYINTKGTDPLSGNPTHLYHPRRDNWNEHLIWSDNFEYLIGKTNKGRATVLELQLNRDTLIEHRRILISIQKHPMFLF